MTDDTRSRARWPIMATAGRRRLTFEEVLAAGRPAVYRKFGDHLLYVGGRLFDVREPERRHRSRSAIAVAAPDEHEHARLSVGIEYGWRHAAGCSCLVLFGVARGGLKTGPGSRRPRPLPLTLLGARPRAPAAMARTSARAG